MAGRAGSSDLRGALLRVPLLPAGRSPMGYRDMEKHAFGNLFRLWHATPVFHQGPQSLEGRWSIPAKATE